MAITKVDLANVVTGVLPVANGGTGTSTGVAPGGSTTQVQYNNAGAFGGSANFVFDGTNVGIGTSSPDTKLVVAGSNVSGIGLFQIKGTDVAQQTFYISTTSHGQIYTDGTQFLVGSVSSTPLVFRTANTERMRIDSSGNVGIGTNSPASDGKLSVESNGSASSEINISLINGISNKECIVNFGNNLATAGRYKGRIFYQVDNNVMGFWTNTTERMRITANGGIAFSGSTNYGSSGQLLQSNGDAAPTWVTAALLGSGQTWTDVGGSRSSGTTYTNSTGKPIQIMVCTDNTGNTTYGSAGAAKFYINGSNVGQQFCSNAANIGGMFQAVIPNGSTYSVSASTIRTWWELR